MRIGLKQEKIDELIASLYEVSDPTHSRYGQHLRKKDVDALVRPHAQTVKIVDEWLSYHGVDADADAVTRTGAGEWIELTVTVEKAERMLSQYFLTDILSITDGNCLKMPSTRFINTRPLPIPSCEPWATAYQVSSTVILT
jgi:hypothetical protein